MNIYFEPTFSFEQLIFASRHRNWIWLQKEENENLLQLCNQKEYRDFPYKATLFCFEILRTQNQNTHKRCASAQSWKPNYVQKIRESKGGWGWCVQLIAVSTRASSTARWYCWYYYWYVLVLVPISVHQSQSWVMSHDSWVSWLWLLDCLTADDYWRPSSHDCSYTSHKWHVFLAREKYADPWRMTWWRWGTLVP